MPLEEQRKIFNEIVKKNIFQIFQFPTMSSKFRKKKEFWKFDVKYKSEGRYPKDFRNYQNPIRLFKDLRDGNVNPKKILKN